MNAAEWVSLLIVFLGAGMATQVFAQLVKRGRSRS